MIVTDASALVAILLEEDEATVFAEALADHDVLLSPVGYWEACVRMRNIYGEEGVRRLDLLLHSSGVRMEPITASTARLASEAERRFGKRTSARLNLGDCFAYALAQERSAPLLYKGDDFSETDVVSALED